MTARCANGWTGGQYSVFRCALGVYLLVHFARLVPAAFEMTCAVDGLGEVPGNLLPPLVLKAPFCWDSPVGIASLLLAGAGLSALFALGVRDRAAGLTLLCLGISLVALNPSLSNSSPPLIGLILLAHAFVPRRPYGSWEARGRTDPAGDWRMPAGVHAAAWIALALAYAYSGAIKLGDPAWLDGSALSQALSDPLARQTFLGHLVLQLPPPLLALATWGALALQIGFAPLASLRKFRPWLWWALLGVQLCWMALGHFAEAVAGIAMLHLFAFDPGWVKGAAEPRPATIFYDGGCGLCHRTVRFVIAEDRDGTRFRFAPLEGSAFAALRKSFTQPERLEQIDSIVLSLPDGNLLVRAPAVLEIAKRLGGLWRVAAIAVGVLPMRVLDAGYAGIAKIRRRIFAKPPGACPILPTELLDRFDLD